MSVNPIHIGYITDCVNSLGSCRLGQWAMLALEIGTFSSNIGKFCNGEIAAEVAIIKNYQTGAVILHPVGFLKSYCLE